MITRAGQSLSKMTPIRGANGTWSRVRTGRGKHGRGGRKAKKELTAKSAVNSESEDTVASLAEECGVSERTARNRLKAAREYSPNKPEVVQGAHGPLCR